MKLKIKYILAIPAIAFFASCKKDNYDPPSALLTGKLVYQGEAINVEKDQVPFQLYQYGFGKVGPITQTFAQDGSYSAALFNGEYKLIIPNGQGPFMWKKTSAGNPDSVVINLNGSQALDLEVTPYYLMKNAQITGTSSTVTATFQAAKIITDANAKDIERVSLYINKTQFVSGGNNIAVTDLAGSSITDPSNITLSVTVPAMTPTQNYVYARVGLKIAGVEDMIFSPLVQVTF